MNIIQKALEMQNIFVAWGGTEPGLSATITTAYLEGNVDGFPRMVRTADDAGTTIDLTQLRADYDVLRTTSAEDTRIAMIKEAATDLILSRHNEVQQRNLTARGFELIRAEQGKGKRTAEEATELAEIEAIWAWIKSVRSTSNTAEVDDTAVHLIDWPE